MNIQSLAQSYFPKSSHSGFRQNLQQQRGLDLADGIQLCSAVGKVVLVILPLVLVVNLWIASAVNSIETKIQIERQSLAFISQQNTNLEKGKERLLSPVRIQVLAAEKLSLMVPRPDQMQRIAKYVK